MRTRVALAVTVALGPLFSACKREERPFRESIARASTPAISQSALHPGRGEPPPAVGNPLEGNAWAIGEGRRLYFAYNCAGCHFNGGGGIGPALMDKSWIYGSSSANIFATIVEGRPNGMPSFRDRLTEQQVWQITAYVRALAELPGAGKAPMRVRDGERMAEGGESPSASNE